MLEIEEEGVVLDNNSYCDADATVLCTCAVAPKWLVNSGFKKSKNLDFLLTNKCFTIIIAS